MNPLLRAAALAALALACIDSRAGPHRSCIRSLGVQGADESPKPTLAPKKNCVTAIAFAPHAPGARADRHATARETERLNFHRV